MYYYTYTLTSLIMSLGGFVKQSELIQHHHGQINSHSRYKIMTPKYFFNKLFSLAIFYTYVNMLTFFLYTGLGLLLSLQLGNYVQISIQMKFWSWVNKTLSFINQICVETSTHLRYEQIYVWYMRLSNNDSASSVWNQAPSRKSLICRSHSYDAPQLTCRYI